MLVLEKTVVLFETSLGLFSWYPRHDLCTLVRSVGLSNLTHSVAVAFFCSNLIHRDAEPLVYNWEAVLNDQFISACLGYLKKKIEF